MFGIVVVVVCVEWFVVGFGGVDGFVGCIEGFVFCF